MPLLYIDICNKDIFCIKFFHHTKQCISVNALKSHVNKVGYLGECSSNYTKVPATNGPSGIAVYPNSTSGQFTLQLNNIKASEGVVLILDAKGSIIKRRKLKKEAFPYTISCNPGNNAQCVYTAKVVFQKHSAAFL